jgi:hypothetical protein
MIGRVSTAPAAPTTLRPSAQRPTSEPRGAVLLPADLREGDLIAIPSTTVIALRELRRQAVHPERYDG